MIGVININVVEVAILIGLMITGGELRSIQTGVSLLLPGNPDSTRHKNRIDKHSCGRSHRFT